MINIGIGLSWASRKISSAVLSIIIAFKTRVLAIPAVFENGSFLNLELNWLSKINLLDNASLILTPNSYIANKIYSVVPNTVLGDFDSTRATTATRVNSNGLIEIVATGIPRLDYTDGTASLLLEPQRTNSIPNSTMVGALTSPSTMPTGWQSNLNGLTQTIVGIGTENGLNYIDVRFNGTASSSPNSGIRMTNTTTISALQNQNWTFSSYVKILAQPLPASSYQLSIYERSSSGTFLQSTTTLFNNTTLNRISLISTLANASTAFIQPDIIANTINGQSYDFTIRIAGTQLELGSYATSYIPTTTSTVTRNQDLASVSGVSSLIGQTEGVMFVESAALANDLTARLVAISDGTSNNRIVLMYNNATNMIATAMVSNAVTIIPNINYTITDETQFIKMAVRYSNTLGVSLWINGVNRGGSLLNTLPISMNRFSFDGGSPGNVPFFSKVKSAQLYKTYLTDAEMASLTTL